MNPILFRQGPWVILLLSVVGGFAQSGTVVAPGTLAERDAPFGSGTLRAPGFRIQQVYGAQHFPSNGMIITELRFRPDYFYGRAFTSTVASIQFSLSTTTRTPDGLSSTFDQNPGDDQATVFSGGLTVSSQFTGPAAGPKEFDINIPLKTVA